MAEIKKENEELNKGLRLIAKSSFIIFICLFIGKILVYIYRAIIARFLNPEVFGLYSLAIMISSWFALIASLGFSENLPRYMPIFRGKKRLDNVQYIFRFSLKFLTISSLIAAGILFILSKFIAINIFHNSELIIFLRYFSLAVPLIVIATPFIAALRSYEKITWHALIGYIFHNIVSVISIIILLYLGLHTKAIIFSYLLGIFITLASAYILSKKVIPEIFRRDFKIDKEKKQISKEFIMNSLPLLFASFVGVLSAWIDSFSLGFYKSAFEVGLYNAAMPIAMLLGITPELFMQLYVVLIGKEYAKNNNGTIKELTKQIEKWIFIINLPAFILIFTFPDVFLNILFGQNYIISKYALRILVIGTFSLSIIGPTSRKLILMAGKSKLLLYNTIIFAGSNFLLNSILVPMEKIGTIDNANGLVGAAIATVISSLIFSIITIIQIKTNLSFVPLRKKMLRVLMAGLLATIPLLFFKQFFVINLTSLVLLGILFISSYILLIFITGCLDKNDLLILGSIKKKFFSKKSQYITN